MARRRWRRRQLGAVSAEGDAEGVQSPENQAKFKDYLQHYYYQLSRPRYGWIHRIVIWFISYYGINAMLLWKVIGVAPGDYSNIVMTYRQDAVNLLAFVAVAGAFLVSWFYFSAMRKSDWKWDEVIEGMYEPENAPRLQEAQKLAREQLDAELESERLKEQLG